MGALSPSLPATASRISRPAVIALGVFVAGAAIAIAIHLRLQTSDRQQLESRITIAVDYRMRTLQAAIRSYEDCLNAMRTLFTFSAQVSLREFEGAARDLILRYPGIAALEWATLIDGPDRNVFESRIRNDVRPDFRIMDRTSPGVMEPAVDAPAYLPVVYIEPLPPHLRALGYNLFTSGSSLRIETARETGLTTLSRLIALELDDEPVRGFIAYAPVYGSLPPLEGAVSPPGFRGFIIGVFRLDRFFADAPEELGTVGYEFLVVDRTSDGPEGVFALHLDDDTTQIHDLPALADFLTPESRRIPMRVWERDWEFIFRPTQAWLDGASRRHPYALLLVGFAASGAFSLLLYNRLRYTALIEQQVAERTAELNASRGELAVIMDHSPNVIFLKDLEGHYLMGNRRFLELYGKGRASAAGCTDEELFPPETAAIFRANDEVVIKSGETQVFEEVTEAGGRIMTSIVYKFPLRAGDGTIRAIGGVTTDITSRKQAESDKLAVERKLLEGQKLESLGVLAGGIAHDFNNLLTGIMGNASLVTHELPAGSPVQPHLRQIESAALRAAELCQQMLAYSGKGRFIIESVNLGDLVQGTVPLLHLSINKSVRLRFQFAPGLPGVMADATQMRQILMNLVINASDAIGSGLGEIVISTGTTHADEALFKEAVLAPSLPEGDYVFLEVRDTGGGMDPATLARIFDPFFTTKFAGRGLGLAAVLGIVRGHHGALFVESHPGRGSTFRLLLPQSTPDQPKPSGANSEPSRTPWRRQGRVLLVDDEEAVRFVGENMLKSFGLTVDSVANGTDAISRFEYSAVTYELVVLDLTMPGMGGDEVLRRLRAQQPNIRVLLMSGYSEQEVVRRLDTETPTAFIQKPFSVGSLRAKLREIMGEEP